MRDRGFLGGLDSQVGDPNPCDQLPAIAELVGPSPSLTVGVVRRLGLLAARPGRPCVEAMHAAPAVPAPAKQRLGPDHGP
jgi:hypothetical protein